MATIVTVFGSVLLGALIALSGGAAGRGLAALLGSIAKAEGYPSCRYYALSGGSWLTALPLIGHFARTRGARCPRLFWLEVGGAVAGLLCWLLFPAGKAACGGCFLCVLMAASVIDLDHMIIPDLFSVGLAVAGVVLSALVPSLHGAAAASLWTCLRSGASALLGAAVGSSILLWFSIIGELVLGREVMGFGDVKFVGAIGAFCGWQGAVFAIFGGAALGAVALLVCGAFRLCAGGGGMLLFRRPASASRNGRVAWGVPFPFGPMLAGAAALYFLALHPVVDGYLAQYQALF